MIEKDLMRLSEFFDEKVDLSEFTVEEIEQMLNEFKTDKEKFKTKYFEFYDDVKSPSLRKQDW